MNMTRHTAETCPTCTNSAVAPYRRYEGSRVVEGCIDSFHDGKLVSPSESFSWHNRKPAREWRKAQAIHMKAFDLGYLRLFK